MKTLLIMRHAESDSHAGLRSDFDRPINEQGHQDLLRIAQLLGEYGLRPDAIMASSALRARQTAEGMISALNLQANTLNLDDSLYLASPATLLKVAIKLPENAQTGLIIAHNPGLEEWIGQFSGARVVLPTAGLAAFQLACFSWTEIDQTYGQLIYFVVPRVTKAINR